jgi:tripartite-type tricarboxylate transporter receptor subunit TctC
MRLQASGRKACAQANDRGLVVSPHAEDNAMINMRTLLLTVVTVVAAGLPGSSRLASAQDYPSRAIHFITPFPAGPSDLVIRFYAEKISQDWHQPAVIDNRPGATGSIGTQAVVQAQPDGHTLLFTVDLPISMAPNLMKVPYDPRRDLIPIAAVVESSGVLIVNASGGIRTLTELIAAAKAKPGVLTFSSAGIGSPAHLCGEMIKQQAGINMIHVPYKGAGPAMNAVLAGEVTMFCGPIAQSLPFIKAGRFNALGVSGPKASALLPGVEPLSAAFPGLVISNWFGLLAPARTPAAVCDKLRAEFEKIYADAELRQKLVSLGLEPNWISGSDLAKRIDEQLEFYRNFIAAANIHPG